MKRSEINRQIETAQVFFADCGFYLPPFAYWTPEAWSQAGSEADEIRTRHLGWDVTDFNLGTFHDRGLTLFTLRNGRLDDAANSKVYAEKIMMVEQGQVTPFHFHWKKTEDIINRGAGRLVVELYNATPDEQLADTPVVVSCDGVLREVAAGGRIVLEPGESVTLVPHLYHQFYAEKGSGTALIGEVSSVNDDATDNRFLEPLGRYAKIDEDEPAVHLLCQEYPQAS